MIKPIVHNNTSTATPFSLPMASSAQNNPAETQPEEPSSSKWSTLPGEILSRILCLLDGPAELNLLRSVCPSWRNLIPHSLTLPLPSHLPTISLPLPSLSSSPHTLLLPSTFHLLTPRSPTHPPTPFLTRMGFFDATTRHLFNPFNIHDLFLPSPPLIGSLNLFDCHFFPLLTTYSIINPKSKKAEPLSKKVVGGWDLSSPSCPFSFLAQLERENKFLLFWKYGDTTFTHIDTSNIRIFDIAFHRGKFFSFDLTIWKIGVINNKNIPEEENMKFDYFPAPNILSDEEIDGYVSVCFNGVSYLLRGAHFVPSGENLYLCFEVGPVAPRRKARVLAFLMRENGVEGEANMITWENVSDLGDQIFFIGYDATFALPSEKLPQWKPNSVCLFTRPFPLIFDSCYEGYNSTMPEGLKCMDMVNFACFYRYIRMFTMGEERKGVIVFQKLPRENYTHLFFPPPAWITWRCPSRGDDEVKIHEIKYTDAVERFGDYPYMNELSDDEED